MGNPARAKFAAENTYVFDVVWNTLDGLVLRRPNSSALAMGLSLRLQKTCKDIFKKAYL